MTDTTHTGALFLQYLNILNYLIKITLETRNVTKTRRNKNPNRTDNGRNLELKCGQDSMMSKKDYSIFVDVCIPT